MMRWTEEVTLLQEEMRRIVAFLEWEVADWTKKAEVEKSDLELREGKAAYAIRQASLRSKWISQCLHKWRNIPRLLQLAAGALEDPNVILPTLDNNGKFVVVKEKAKRVESDVGSG